MIIGVDNGNSYTKTEHFSFVSGIREHDLEPVRKEEMLKYEGKYYTLSKERNVYNRDKTDDDKTFILTLFAIAKEIKESGVLEDPMSPDVVDGKVIVDLAIGLPPGHFSALKEKFTKYFNQAGSEIFFEFGGEPMAITLNSIGLYPQGFSAIVFRKTELKEYSTVYILDIGGYTVDIVGLSDKVLDLDTFESLEMGVITMFQKIIDRVYQVNGIKLTEKQITDVLRGKKNLISEKFPEIKQLVFDTAEQHAEEILSKLRESGKDLIMNPVIFVGGGSLLLKDFLEKSDKLGLSEFLPDTTANASGYKMLHEFQLKKQNSGKRVV